MGAFDDLIPQVQPSQAPQSSGAFDDLIPQRQARQTRRGIRYDTPDQSIDTFEGLPEDTISEIKESIPLGGRGIAGQMASRSRAANLERIRQDNPYLAETIEDTTPFEATAVGFQQGLRTVGRGAGKIIRKDFFPEVNSPELQALQSVRTEAQGGKILGEAAPFIPLAGSAGGIVSTPLRTAAMSGVGGLEGGTIAAGEDRPASEVVQSAALGAVIGAGAEAAPAIINRLRGKSVEAKKLLKEPTKREIAEGVADAAPTSDQLRKASSGIYNDVKDLGIKVNKDSYEGLYRETLRDVNDLIDLPKAGESLTPESARIIKRMEGVIGGEVDISELERIRRLAKDGASAASRQGRNQDAAAAGAIADSIDDYLFTINPKNLSGQAKNIGQELKVARDLWGRAKRSDLLEDAITIAKNQDTGFENGIRVKFRQILNNKKLSKFFSEEEKKAMESVIQGSKGANFFKALGKMGFFRGQQTNVMSGTLGAYAASDLFGGIAGVLLSTAGQISKGFAERLTKNNAAMATQLIRAGKNADDIAKTYLRFTPKAQQSADDLSQLFMRPEIDLSNIDLSNGIVAQAVEKANANRIAPAAASATIASQASAEEEN